MSYSFEWIPGLTVVGIVALVSVPGLALIVLLVVLLAAVAGVVALAGAIVAGPYLFIRGRLRARAGAAPKAHATALMPARHSGGAA